VRNCLADFYLTIKANAEHLHFTFITGVTKFSRMSVFSVLNNLKDISLDPKFAALVGFTQDELEADFSSHIDAAAAELGMGREAFLKKFKNYYDGFSFDGKTMLYNPNSALLFFEETKKKFTPYWIESGSDALIRDRLRDWNLTPAAFEGLNLPESFFKFPGEIGKTSPAGFLYQAGYLSLRASDFDSYTTVYPNLEVRQSINRLFLANMYEPNLSLNLDTQNLAKALAVMDIQKIVDNLRRQLFSVSYQRYSKALNNPASPDVLPIKEQSGSSKQSSDNYSADAEQLSGGSKDYDESYYRDLIQVCLGSVGCDVITERNTSIGRTDLDVRFWGQVLIIELKMKGKNDKAITVAERAYKQIIDKDYASPYTNPILIGLAIDPEIKNIVGCVYAKGGTKEALDYPKPTVSKPPPKVRNSKSKAGT
jgi:hypothetical protein